MTTDSGSRGRDDLPGLAAGAMSGDAAALQSLLAAVWRDAYQIARSILRDRQLAEDAAQEACARVMVGLSSLRRPEAVRAWFFRLVTREAYRRLRQCTRETPVEAMAEQAGPAPESVDILDLRRAVGIPAPHLPPAGSAALLLRLLGPGGGPDARHDGRGGPRAADGRAEGLRHALREPPARSVSPCAPGSESTSS